MVKSMTLKQAYTSLKRKRRRPLTRTAYVWDLPDGRTFHRAIPDVLSGEGLPYATLKEARAAMASFVQDFAQDEGWSKTTARDYLAQMRIYKITLTAEEL
jgi:hypothetical protein